MVRTQSIKWLSEKALASLQRFPMVMLSAFLLALYSIYMSDTNQSSLMNFIVLSSLSLGIPLFLSIDLFLESKQISQGSRFFSYAGGVAFLLAWYFFVGGQGTFGYYNQFLPMSLALHLLVSFAFFTGRENFKGFWQFNKTIFLQILLSALYAGVLCVGLEIALLTTDKLFKLSISGKNYFHIFVLSMVVFQTWHFLSGLPKDFSQSSEDQEYPRGLRVFVQYLLIPLITVYMIILYVYMGKILITWDWPRGYVGWLVSISSVLGLFNLLLLDPEKSKSTTRWIQSYAKYYYVFVLPLLGMLFIALGKRISTYGMTEPRYFLLALGLLLFGLALYFLFSKAKDIKVVPISLFIVSILSLFGPWSAQSISLKSQKQRVIKILEDHQLLKNGQATNSGAEVSKEVESHLSSLFDYIIKNHSAQSLTGLFPDELLKSYRDQEKAKDYGSYSRSAESLMEYMGLDYLRNRYATPSKRFSFNIDSRSYGLGIQGYQEMIQFSSSKNQYIDINNKDYQVTVDKHKAALKIKVKGELVAEVLLTEWVRSFLKNSNKNYQYDINFEKMKIPFKGKGLKGLLLINFIGGTKYNDRVELTGLKGLIFLKSLN